MTPVPTDAQANDIDFAAKLFVITVETKFDLFRRSLGDTEALRIFDAIQAGLQKSKPPRRREHAGGRPPRSKNPDFVRAFCEYELAPSRQKIRCSGLVGYSSKKSLLANFGAFKAKLKKAGKYDTLLEAYRNDGDFMAVARE